jgi:hypothetical protein
MDKVTRRRFVLTTIAAGPTVFGLSTTTTRLGLPQQLYLPPNPSARPDRDSQSGAATTEEPSGQTPEQVFQELKSLPYSRAHLRWAIGFTQHSMYMITDEDRGVPMVGERHMPWGAPDASVYVQRTLHNMEALVNIPQLRLTYDYPGCDIESIAARFPDILTKMQEMHRRGVLDFVNGTYSEPHLQVLSSESNWRQFEYGLPVFKKLFNKDIKLYAFQEVSQHVQLPQILAQFGYQMLCMGAMPWAMEIIEGPFVFQSDYCSTQFVHGNQFVEAVALDGTSLPAYLMEPTGPLSDNPNSDQNVKTCIDDDLFGPSRIWPYFPDHMEVTRDLYDEISVLFDFVLLDKALGELIKTAPPRAKARVFSYWSYAEGVWAEALLRANREAEQVAILAEAMQAMAEAGGIGVDRSEEINAIWHRIIKYQSHDVNWIEVTDLRRKAINYLNDGIDSCERIMESLTEKLLTEDPNSLAIFNGLPAPRSALIKVHGQSGLAGGPLQEFQGKSFGVRKVPAGGYRSFALGGGNAIPSKEISLPKEITTADYAVALSETGLMEQISTRDKRLLNSDRYLGGELRVMINKQWVDNRSARCQFYEGPVAYILVRTTTLGEVPVVERYFFFRNENYITVELDFDFSGNTWGEFWFDETKLNVYYPTTNSEIYHDIPFGYVMGREKLPLFATSWLYSGGLAYVNWGTVKHWVRDGVIANVLAWGGYNFGNRLQFGWAHKSQYDIRLYGKQRVKYALIPYSGFDGNRIVRDVAALTSPVFITKGIGEKSVFAIDDKDIAITSVYSKGGQIWTRGYQLPVGRASRYRDWEIFNAPIQELKSPLSKLTGAETLR